MSRSFSLPSALLGGMSVETFMRDYWQKRPLLIRGAVPLTAGSSPAPLTRDELFALATLDDVESRLVMRRGGDWSAEHGPFEKLPSPRSRALTWTLLVQGVNLHDDRADALLRRFDFIPQARLDDLMISYAPDGGGVGPHFDSYDVFLLQAHGQRRWRIGKQKDLTLLDDVPLKILANFQSSQEWLLDVGDMLYLPPQYAHEGTAVGECMTCSIGFRAPPYDELAREFLFALADCVKIPGRYADPGRAPVHASAGIDAHLSGAVARRIATVKWTEADVADFLASYLSEPKASVYFDAPAPLTAKQFERRARRDGLRLHRKSTMLYSKRRLSINGEPVDLGELVATSRRSAMSILKSFADMRGASAAQCVAWFDQPKLTGLANVLHQWYSHGWVDFDA